MKPTKEQYRFPVLEKLHRFIPEGMALSFLLWLLGIKLEIEGEFVATGPLIVAVTDHTSQVDNVAIGNALIQKGRRRITPVASGDYWKRLLYLDALLGIFTAGAYFTRTNQEKADHVPSDFLSQLYENVRPPEGRFSRLFAEARQALTGRSIHDQNRHTLFLYPKGTRGPKEENESGIFKAAAALFLGYDRQESISVPIQPVTISGMLPALEQGDIPRKELFKSIRQGIRRSLLGNRHVIKITVHPAIYPVTPPAEESLDLEIRIAILASMMQKDFEQYDAVRQAAQQKVTAEATSAETPPAETKANQV